MANEKTAIENEVTLPAGEMPAPRPNREKYAAMWKEDNPDVDFEDGEARYERMAKDREDLRSLRSSGRELSSVLNNNRWMGAMFNDLRKNPGKNPLVWFAENGIDIRAALDDPKVMDEVTEAFNKWTKKQADGEAAEKAQDEAIGKSLDALTSVQQQMGLSDEQKDRMWTYFWDDVFLPAFKGEVSKDTWTSLVHGMNYDTDLSNAREEAAMQARNEKHTNKLKTFDEQQVPPSFSQGSGQTASPKKERRESLMDFVKRNT